MVSSSIAAILSDAFRTKKQGLPGEVHILGTSLESQAYFLTQTLKTLHATHPHHRTLIVLSRDDDHSLELSECFNTLCPIFFKMPVKSLILPSWEHSPYSPITPSIQTRLHRLKTLSTLIQDSASEFKIIFCTLAASFQTTLSPQWFRDFSISLRTHTSIVSIPQITQRLTNSGYQRTDLVEDPGTFSTRGDILDIFPPDRDYPLRIDLFGDDIESIKEFDPSTQRTLPPLAGRELAAVFIPPAREVLINKDTESNLKNQIKTRADDQGIPRTLRDPIISHIQNHFYSEYSDTWAAFAYSEPSHFWKYIPEAGLILWNQAFQCHQDWTKWKREQEPLSKEAEKMGRVIPHFSELYDENSIHSSEFISKQQIFFDSILLDNLEGETKTTPHEISTQRIIQAQEHISLDIIESKIRLHLESGADLFGVVSTPSQLNRIQHVLSQRKIPVNLYENDIHKNSINLILGNLERGFEWMDEKVVFYSESELLGTRSHKVTHAKSSKKSSTKEWSGLQTLSDLGIDDFIVHRDHGIGRYKGISRLNLSGGFTDFLLIEYAQKDKLYIPIYRLNLIQKYIGGDEAQLDRLGTQHFSIAKEKAKESAKKLAIDLLSIYAQRKLQEGIKFSVPTLDFDRFEAEFPHEETPDQLKAIKDITDDLTSGRMMDRLICGDVGFGKTEVAIRAAYLCVTQGKQVAVLVPTTILAHQHEQTFKNRFKSEAIVIDSLTRFKTKKEQKITLERVQQGKIDILIGTHRLLSQDVHFQELGLLIVDEEHRFGVEHKEKIKALQLKTHVLTLTATPIPRTLQMALSGMRDISLISTPPVDRLPIKTYVLTYDELTIKRAIEYELSRGGQIFYLHHQVKDIERLAEKIQKLVPQARITLAHGQMKEALLEERIRDFYEKAADVLICTTIIESGIDLPSANTIIIGRADTLGLAQLYQIRGRVGRSRQRGFAYLLIPSENSLSEDALKRLEVIQKFVELGSGFSIATHDLEIRGGGDLLGPQQSGNINAVGFELYTELLEEAIQDIQGKTQNSTAHDIDPEIKLPYPAFLSDEYIPNTHQKLNLYRRLSSAQSEAHLLSLEEELMDRFGPIPTEAQNLIWLIRIKIILKKYRINSLTVGTERITLIPNQTSLLDSTKVISLISAHPHEFQLTPESKLVLKLTHTTIIDLYFELEKILIRFS